MVPDTQENGLPRLYVMLNFRLPQITARSWSAELLWPDCIYLYNLFSKDSDVATDRLNLLRRCDLSGNRYYVSKNNIKIVGESNTKKVQFMDQI